MPHIVVKLYSGRSEEQKAKLAEEMTRAIIETLRCSDSSVSVGIEDVEPTDWIEKVYQPDIVAKADTIYKKPGYDPA